MSRKVNIALQIIGLATQIANGLSPYWSTNVKMYVMAGLSLAQGAVAIIAHSFNVDGTPQEAAYQPPQKGQ